MRTVTNLVFCLAAISGVLLGSVSAPASADKNYDRAVQNVTLDAELAVDTKNFAALEKSADHYRTTKSRIPGGQWSLFWFYDSFRRVLYGGKQSPSQSEVGANLDLWIKFAEAWIAKYPDSPTPYIAHASVLRAYAWYRRGNGYAYKVWKDDMDVFHQYLEKANDNLEKRKSIASTDPHWYYAKLDVMQGLGGPIQAMIALAQEGASKERYYYPMYAMVMESLAPRWYGTLESMDAWAGLVADMTKEQDGESAYARMYWTAYYAFGGDFLRESAVDTKRLARGFKDLVERYPDLHNYWHARNIACGTNDAAWAREQWKATSLKYDPRGYTGIDPRSGCGWALTGDSPADPDVLPLPPQPPGAKTQKSTSDQEWPSQK